MAIFLWWEGTKAMKIDPMAEDTNSVRLFNLLLIAHRMVRWNFSARRCS
jgi:hypothetical protein